MDTKTVQEIDKDNTAAAAPSATQRRPILRRPWLWLLLLGLAAAGIVAYVVAPQKASPNAGQTGTAPQGGRRGANAMRSVPVVTVPVRVGDISVYLNGLGSVIPLNNVTVRTRVDGQLMKVLFSEGQTVKRGELLAEIDPRPYQVQLAQAEGQMARDQALLKNAKIDLERYRTLFQQDSIARQQLDTQEALVRQYEGGVKVDQGQIDSAKLQLSYARVTAPISGRIGLRQVDPGNIVHASDANGLVVITQVQPAGVLFTMPEDSIPAVMRKLRAGDQLAVDAYDRAQKNKLASGVLLTVDNQIDPTTGTVKLKAQFANEELSLFPNQFVNTRMLVDVKRGVTIIPSAGVQRGSQGSFVYLLKEDRTVTVRPVKLGITQGDDTEIAAGLAAGELVVVEGADKLREGAKVEVAGNPANAPHGPGGNGRWKGKRQGERSDAAQDGNAGAPPGSGAAGDGHRRRRSGDPAGANGASGT